jgi:hypothetical protein
LYLSWVRNKVAFYYSLYCGLYYRPYYYTSVSVFIFFTRRLQSYIMNKQSKSTTVSLKREQEIQKINHKREVFSYITVLNKKRKEIIRRDEHRQKPPPIESRLMFDIQDSSSTCHYHHHFIAYEKSVEPTYKAQIFFEGVVS